MALSVIVTSYESSLSLFRCLSSLDPQEEAGEIVVSDCSRIDPSVDLQTSFPRVRFLHFSTKHTVPQLRWMALAFVTGECVAAVEARCIPANDWCGQLLSAHSAWPECPAIGGPVAIHDHATRFEWGLYLCEYGLFAPPVRIGDTRALSGANLSYRRSALDASSDLTDQGSWETLLHERWLSQGRRLALSGAAVTFFNSMSRHAAIRQRWHYGRGYAAERISGSPLAIRIVYAAGACILPLLLICRIGLVSYRKRLLPEFIRSLSWVSLFCVCWSAGEMAGYALGKSSKAHIF